MRFKIDWASLIVGRKFTVFALFYFVFEGYFEVQAPGRGGGWGGSGAYTWGGVLTEGFLRYKFRGLIHKGAYLRYPSTSLVAFIDIPIHLVPAMFSIKTAGY